MKKYRRESKEGDTLLRWLGTDIVGLICHLQVSAYYREGQNVNMCVCVCVCV